MNGEMLYGPHRRAVGEEWPQPREPPARCNACGGRVPLSSGPAYDGLETDRALCEMAVRVLAEGHALRATARIVQGDKDTVGA